MLAAGEALSLKLLRFLQRQRDQNAAPPGAHAIRLLRLGGEAEGPILRSPFGGPEGKREIHGPDLGPAQLLPPKAGMPPAAPFLVPARKGGKNRPGRGKIPNLSPLPGPSPHSNGQKGSSPFWKSPRYHQRRQNRSSRDPGLHFSECCCNFAKNYVPFISMMDFISLGALFHNTFSSFVAFCAPAAGIAGRLPALHSVARRGLRTDCPRCIALHGGDCGQIARAA